MKLTARYELIAPFAGEAFINPPKLIEVELLEEEVEKLKNLLKANSINETYLGELGWYLIKAKKLSTYLKESKANLRQKLEDFYLGITYFREVESIETIIKYLYKHYKTEKNKTKKDILKEQIQNSENEKSNFYQKYSKEVKKFSNNELISIVRKTHNDLQIFEEILFELNDIDTISFLNKNGKVKTINRFDKKRDAESNFVINHIKGSLLKRYANMPRYTYAKVFGKTLISKSVKKGKVVEEAREIKTLLLDPPRVANIISKIGIDDQKQNRNNNEYFQEEVEFISCFYRFLDSYFSFSNSEYGITNFIAGLLYFANYEGFNVEKWLEYKLGSSNQDYREYVEIRIDNDMLATSYKQNRKAIKKLRNKIEV
ncbi:MAG: hypothetical protein ACOVOQ_14730 [Flavobacterium sp.]